MNNADNYQRYINLAHDKYDEEYSTGEYCHEQSFVWGYQEGYDQAETDFTLTWEDVMKIESILKDVMYDARTKPYDEVGWASTGQGIYEEVLRRFNEMKNN